MSPEMKYIFTVYQEGSFSKAAEKLFITQPALSIAVKKVEDEIGMPLFDRRRKPLTLTEAGEVYIDTVKKTQLLEMERNQKLDDIKNLSTGLVRVGGTHFLNSYILPPYFAEYSRKYPGITLTIYERSSFEMENMLSSKDIDLTFSCKPEEIRKFPNIRMFEDHVIFAVPVTDSFNDRYREKALSAADILSGRHLMPDTPKLSIKEIGDQEIILLRKGNNLYERVLKMYLEESVEPHVKLDLNQLVTAYHLAEAGMGSVFTSDRLVKKWDDRLLFYPLASPLASRTFHILLASNAYVPIAVQKMVDLLQKPVLNS